MTQTKMMNKLFYSLMVIGSFGVFTATSAMEKEVVTRADKNYLPTAKENLKNAQAVDQINLTAIKGDIKRTEKELQVRPLNFDQDSTNSTSIAPRRTSAKKEMPSLFVNENSQRPKLALDNSAIMEKYRVEQEQLRKEEEKKAMRMQKQLAQKEADALRLAAVLEERSAIIDEYSNYDLSVENTRPKNKTLPRKGSSHKKQQPYEQQITFDFLNDFDDVATVESTPLVSTNNTNSVTDAHIVTRGTHKYPIEAPKNLKNAEDVNQPNLTPLRKDVKQLRQQDKK